MKSRTFLSFVLAFFISTLWLIPAASPSRGVAGAQTLAQGYSVVGDFKGAGSQQIATLYDPNDDLGLRIVVHDRAAGDVKLNATQWFVAGAGQFDLGRMKVASLDLNADAKSDIAALYNNGGFTVHVVVWLSTGTSFTYQGNQGWFRHTNFDWNRVRDLLPGVWNPSAGGRTGIVIPYALDNFQLKLLYLESTLSGLRWGGDWGIYDSGPGQIDATKARFVAGRFTRATGSDQVAMIYQYPDFSIKVHVFDSTPVGALWPSAGWSGRWTSPSGFFDISKARFTAADVDGDKQADILDLYAYPDGSSRVHLMFASEGHALRDPIGVAFPPGAIPWASTQLLAGDWNKDGKADVATVSSDDNAVTHIGVLTSGGKTLVWAADQWVTPANEVQKLACSACWPLNGMPIAAGGPLVTRRPLAVKIDNAPAARPHYGISQADMVWELLVEGFITRLAAYYHSQDPGTIGAVRSVRFSDRYTTPMVRGSLVFSGASQLMERLVREDIAAGYYVGVSPQIGQGNAFYRTNVDGKVAPHNLFTSSAELRRATNEVGGGGAVSVPRWDFLAQANHPPTMGGFLGSVPAGSLTVPYRADARVRYDWDANANVYLRYQSNGARPVLEVDGANGVWIMAKTIVIIKTDIWATDVRDDAGGAASLDMRMTGSGPASVFRDGRRQDGTWSRATNFDPFTFTSFYGQKIYLSPGQTWVHVVPMDWDVPSS
ncbi:MAG TPA: DUF3048 domain-containing protein [Candidatus Limnocylindria bacterium]|jgi:hypothetical protein|nr:DUF3048 domain-containing protein [Candidatus Limnocylindria bacterium]